MFKLLTNIIKNMKTENYFSVKYEFELYNFYFSSLRPEK